MPTNQTINDVLPWTQVSSSTNQTVFDTNWSAAYPADVIVYKRGMNDAPDEETQVLDDIEYTVEFVGTGQVVRVILMTPASNGDIVTITRNTPVDRKNLYKNTNFVPAMLNQDTALLTLVDQERQMYERQAIKYHLTGLNPNFSSSANPPVPELGPNQVWASDPTGTKIIAVDIPAGGGIATNQAKYIVQQPHVGLPNAQALDALPTGIMSSSSADGSVTTFIVKGVPDQISVDSGDGQGPELNIGFADNAVIPGNAGMGIPAGTTAERVIPTPPSIGMRFNTDSNAVEAYIGGMWQTIPSSATGAYLPLTGGTMSGQIDMGGNKIANAGTPTASSDLATKGYVDATASGKYFVSPVVAAQTTNVVGTYDNGVAGIGATITVTANGVATADGVPLALNDRVLFPFQAAPLENGIYIVTNVGSVSTQAVYTRATDYDTTSDIDPGDTVGVTSGASYTGAFFMQTATVTAIGTSPISFSLSSSTNNVTISGTQTITGQKTFSAPTTLGNYVFNGATMSRLGEATNLFSFGAGTQSASIGGASIYDLTSAGIRFGGANARVTTILNDPALAANSATALATQQSIKQYVDGKAGKLVSVQVLDIGSGTTYAKPAGITSIMVEAVGGGGGGGGSTGAASSASGAGGGGSGGYFKLWIPVAAASYTYAVGAGGSSGVAGNNVGGTGGTTTFSTATANGGAGGSGCPSVPSAGAAFVTGGLGGAATGGTINVGGDCGSYGGAVSGNPLPGIGGSSVFGAGARAFNVSAGGFGAGGGGAFSTSTSTAGGNGTNGVILVWGYA